MMLDTYPAQSSTTTTVQKKNANMWKGGKFLETTTLIQTPTFHMIGKGFLS
jgi:hypothetical protein